MDMKLEVVTIPVSDVRRAREFYASLGWRLDTTPPVVVELTPPDWYAEYMVAEQAGVELPT